MKYYLLKSPQADAMSGSSYGHFLAYAQKYAKAYKLANEATDTMPDINNNYGFMFRDKDYSIAGVTALGNKKTNQDRFTAVTLPTSSRMLEPEDKMSAMKTVGKVLGDALLCDKDGNPCLDEATYEIECLAQDSGSTMAAVMIDNTGITVSNVGDSYVLGIVVNSLGKVTVTQLNTLDIFNAQSIGKFVFDNYAVLRNSTARGTVRALQMPRSFGDIDTRASGITHESTESHFYYEDIPGYDSDSGDKLYIVVASDGLIDGMTVPQYAAEYTAVQAVFLKSQQTPEDHKVRLNGFDPIDAKKQDFIFKKFADNIEQALSDHSVSHETVINTALVNSLCEQGIQDLAMLPDNLMMIVAAAGPEQVQPLLISVYDGHGTPPDGHIAAEYLAETYPRALINELNAKAEALNTALPENRRLTGLLNRGRSTTSGETTNATPTGADSGRSTPIGNNVNKLK